MVKNELRKDPFTRCPAGDCAAIGREGDSFCVPRKEGRLAEAALLGWHGAGHGYKRLEEHTFTWPAVKDGLMMLNHAQFEALFSGLDWRRVRAIEARATEAVE